MQGFLLKIQQEKQLELNLQEALILQGLQEQQEYSNYWDSIVILLQRQLQQQQGTLVETEYQPEIESILKDKTVTQLN